MSPFNRHANYISIRQIPDSELLYSSFVSAQNRSQASRSPLSRTELDQARRKIVMGSFIQMRLVLYILFRVLLLVLVNGVAATYSSPDSSKPWLCARSTLMDPFYEIRYGQDVVWQIPPNPRAVLFIAHGRNMEPLSFFDRGTNCPRCYGLPEDRTAVLAALERNYAVIMVKSVNSYWEPWNVVTWPVPQSQDRKIVVSVIKEWTKEHSLEHLPLAAFGHSSGGNFTSLLTLDLDIKSMIAMCTPGEFEVFENIANALAFPPTLFAPMPRDNGSEGFYPKVVNAISILNSKGVPIKEVDIWPTPIHPLTFAEKIRCVDRATSELIYAAYKAEGWLDENDYLIKSPHKFDLEAVLWRHPTLPLCGRRNDLCLVRHVRQVVISAWAIHSFSSLANEEIFKWLEETVFLGSPEQSGSSVFR